jgi:hypothetical protein
MKVPVLALSMGLLVSACGGSGEEQTLIRTYFQAARVNDRASLGNIAMYAWNAEERGAVSRPNVQTVAEEQRRPLQMLELTEALAAARESEETFTQEKIAYQDENFDAINRVLEAEREGDDVGRRDREVQEAWTDWRERTMAHSREVSAALDELNSEQNEASLSMFDPNNPIDVTGYNGELVTKDVEITARIELDGNETEETLTVTLQQAILTAEDGTPMEGRWVVRNIS